MNTHALPGSWVEVRPATEILRTLDENGACNGLPFMAEMVEYCGRRFQVMCRVSKICCETPQMEMRTFPGDDVVLLRGVRCSGCDHGECQNSCSIFWKLAWLKPSCSESPAVIVEDRSLLLARLRSKLTADSYFCQATALASATQLLSRMDRVRKCCADLRYGTYGPFHMASLIFGPLVHKVRRKLLGEWPRGRLARTPVESLNLQSGDWVEVKQLDEIVRTLDSHGKNRGLHFSLDMAKFCGKRLRVRNRLDRMICEATGRLREVPNTVILENVTCQCPFTFGGCPRGQFQYWREIWLRRA